jgi:hypothetical protein
MVKLSVFACLGNAFAALFGHHGDVTDQAEQAGCSRQTVYDHAQFVESVVATARQPGPDRDQLLQDNARLLQENQQLRQQLAQSQHQQQHTILLDEPAQHHLAVVTHAMGLSFNTIEEVFTVLFQHLLATDSPQRRPQRPDRSTIARWVRRYSQQASQVLVPLDAHTRPKARILAPDEIFFHGQPVLMGVEPHSMALLLCQRSADRTGPTWLAALQPFTRLEQVVSDQGSGMQAGLEAFNQARQRQGLKPLDLGLDVFHISKEAQVPLGRAWRRAEASWLRAEQADARLAKAQDRRGPTAKARAAWWQAEADFDSHARKEQAWRQARAALDLFRPDGQLNDRAWAQQQIALACRGLRGPAWEKVVRMLHDRRTLTFLDRLHRQLAEAVPCVELRGALVRLWRLEQGTPSAGRVAQAAVQTVICAKLDPGWWAQYQRVGELLSGVVRASSAVECVNSVLRMQQARHRNVSQEMLDLKRLYWNCRPFRSGKRKQKCPYQHLGAHLPTFDFWELLQRDPAVLAQELSSPRLAA